MNIAAVVVISVVVVVFYLLSYLTTAILVIAISDISGYAKIIAPWDRKILIDCCFVVFSAVVSELIQIRSERPRLINYSISLLVVAFTLSMASLGPMLQLAYDAITYTEVQFDSSEFFSSVIVKEMICSENPSSCRENLQYFFLIFVAFNIFVVVWSAPKISDLLNEDHSNFEGRELLIFNKMAMPFLCSLFIFGGASIVNFQWRLETTNVDILGDSEVRIAYLVVSAALILISLLSFVLFLAIGFFDIMKSALSITRRSIGRVSFKRYLLFISTLIAIPIFVIFLIRGAQYLASLYVSTAALVDEIEPEKVIIESYEYFRSFILVVTVLTLSIFSLVVLVPMAAWVLSGVRALFLYAAEVARKFFGLAGYLIALSIGFLVFIVEFFLMLPSKGLRSFGWFLNWIRTRKLVLRLSPLSGVAFLIFSLVFSFAIIAPGVKLFYDLWQVYSSRFPMEPEMPRDDYLKLSVDESKEIPVFISDAGPESNVILLPDVIETTFETISSGELLITCPHSRIPVWREGDDDEVELPIAQCRFLNNSVQKIEDVCRPGVIFILGVASSGGSALRERNRGIRRGRELARQLRFRLIPECSLVQERDLGGHKGVRFRVLNLGRYEGTEFSDAAQQRPLRAFFFGISSSERFENKLIETWVDQFPVVRGYGVCELIDVDSGEVIFTKGSECK